MATEPSTMVFAPEKPPQGSGPAFHDATGDVWEEIYRHACTFDPEVFMNKMLNIIKNPKLNTTWLFRADILYDDHVQLQIGQADGKTQPRVREVMNISRQRVLVRTLVPSNSRRDMPMNQTCTFHQSRNEDGSVSTLIIYIPHVDDPDIMPFYHPKVKGIAHLHTWEPSSRTGSISIHFLRFPGVPTSDDKVDRTALQLLQLIFKHGQAAGYVKRVNHDLVVSRPRFQDRLAKLKAKYARTLIKSWAEVTDPQKHVFEDLCIAAFLMELWADMYREAAFPGFVDIGCGNGLLVFILNQEGFSGWGFDARRRQSWKNYETDQPSSPSGRSLEQRLLLPYIITDTDGGDDSGEALPSDSVHDGRFPPGTFIVSNHADELTPWTPILAAGSNCPFIMIPCCSHDLSGARYRAPPPKDKSKGSSAYASLVAWVTQIGEDCGFAVETEMMRIPSTRNVGILGRTRTLDASTVDLQAIVTKYGGTAGYRATLMKLLKVEPKGH